MKEIVAKLQGKAERQLLVNSWSSGSLLSQVFLRVVAIIIKKARGILLPRQLIKVRKATASRFINTGSSESI